MIKPTPWATKAQDPIRKEIAPSGEGGSVKIRASGLEVVPENGRSVDFGHSGEELPWRRSG